MRVHRRERRVGIVVMVSLLLGALLAESLAFRIAFVMLAVGSAVLTTLHCMKTSEHETPEPNGQ